jgi:hypothetical protein
MEMEAATSSDGESAHRNALSDGGFPYVSPARKLLRGPPKAPLRYRNPQLRSRSTGAIQQHPPGTKTRKDARFGGVGRSPILAAAASVWPNFGCTMAARGQHAGDGDVVTRCNSGTEPVHARSQPAQRIERVGSRLSRSRPRVSYGRRRGSGLDRNAISRRIISVQDSR